MLDGIKDSKLQETEIKEKQISDEDMDKVSGGIDPEIHGKNKDGVIIII